MKHADLPDKLWGKAILHSTYLSNRSPTATLGGIAPLQFRTKEKIDLSHMRVFGSPAQIFVRSTIREDNKLSNRSISGTFVGISEKGNGYIFLVNKSNKLVEIDSKDVKFNETFAECRERKGQRTNGHQIDPDLTNEKEVTNGEKYPEKESSDEDEQPQIRRPKRTTTARQFLLPGTHLSKKEIEIRKQQYANLCFEQCKIEGPEANYIMNCMASQTNSETKLMKELELLTTSVDSILSQTGYNCEITLFVLVNLAINVNRARTI